jgi:hypothetical protein
MSTEMLPPEPTSPVADQVSAPPEPPGPPAAENTSASETFKRITAIAIATVTIIAAVVAFLQTDADARGTRANRDAQRYAIEALGTRASGGSQVDYGWYGAAQAYYALNSLALTAIQSDDQQAAERYRSVRDKLTALSPLLQEPYFDPEGGFYPDRTSYAADVYLVQATELSELYNASSTLNNDWDDKANTYIVHLTLLAVALALFGLSTTPDDWTRWIFAGAATLIVSVTVIWMVVTFFSPVDVLNRSAIKAYAEGVGAAARGNTQQAISAYDTALGELPSYANAFYERGNAYFTLAQESLGTSPQAAQENLRRAAADYEAARKAGRDDSSVNWNLGWTYYLLGFFEESATANRRALAEKPDLFAVQCNLGATLLADGRIDEARQAYGTAVQIVTRRVAEARDAGKEPPASLWSYLDACASDVDSLQQRLTDANRFWTQAPPKELIADTPEIRTEMQRVISDMRGTLLALEYTGQLPGDRPTVNVSAFHYGMHRKDEDGNFVYDDQGRSIYDDVDDGVFPEGTQEVGILYDFQGLNDGQKEIWKVYRNGIEDPSLRVVAEWEIGESGAAVKPISYAFSRAFVLASGEYTVELYIDYHLVQRGTFVISNE